MHELHPDAELDAALARHAVDDEILQNAPQGGGATKALIAKRGCTARPRWCRRRVKVFARRAVGRSAPRADGFPRQTQPANWMPQ